MSGFNGSGTFNISGVGLPYVPGTVISSSVANQLNTDLATGLSTCITKDGQTAITANIGWNNYNINNLSAIGIGTSVPAYALDIQTTSASGFKIASATSDTYIVPDYYGSGVSSILTGTGAKQLAFGVSGSERMRIDSSGNVGIGTIAPIAKLDVYKTATVSTTNPYSLNVPTIHAAADTASGKALIQLTALSSSSIPAITYIETGAVNQFRGYMNLTYSADAFGAGYFAVSQFNPTTSTTDERMRIDSSGNVGIGTSSPATTLDLGIGLGRRLSIYTDPSDSLLGFGIDLGGGSYELASYAGGAGTGKGKFTWQQYNRTTNTYTELMRINNDGNVGIGTANPISKVHVYGDPQVSTSLTDSGTRGSILRISAANSAFNSGGAIAFANNQGDAANSVGFAAIKGLLADGSNNTSGSIAFLTRASSTDTSLTEKMRVDVSGNVGIGTASLPSKLTVAGSGNFNGIKIGCGPDDASSASDGNTVIGYQVFNGVTSGSGYTTAIGYKSCNGTNPPWRCVAIGAETLQDGGEYCTVIGKGALKAGFGNGDIAIGTDAMGLSNSSYSGGSNTVIGVAAAAYVDSAVNNIAIGYNAGINTIVFGASNIILGNYAELSSNASNDQYVIGNNVISAGGNTITIGNSSGKIYANYASSSAWSFSSDERLKKNIQPDTLGLSFINKLNPVTYNWKANNELDQDNPEYKKENKKDTTAVLHGLLAQQVKAALDSENCSTFDGWGVREDGIQTVAMSAFVLPLINAVKELKAELDTVKTELAALKGL